MKVLVTGAAGFIGFHLVNTLLEAGLQVVGIDNINDYYDPQLKYDRLETAGISINASTWHKRIQSTLNEDYTFVRMNLEDRNQLYSLFEEEQFDVVCNLAAQAGVRYSLENPHTYIDSNIVGFTNILEACRHNNVKHLVYASSSSVYGNSDKMPLSTDDRVDNPISLYAASKKANELMAHTYSHLFGLPTTGLRFFTVYGPWGRPDMALFLFTKAIVADQPIKVFNNGDLYRDFTYVDDIVEGVKRIMINPHPATLSTATQQHSSTASQAPPYAIHNIGNSSPVKLMDFIETIERALGKEAKKEYQGMQPGDVYKTYADVSALEKEYDYKPNTSIKDGVERFVRWYREYYKL